ncbi:MAG: ABC transporter substrate-binding protein, partial [Alphaproteobacteria bacterium]|nr:ABC transporter substrate-binding protein [Alphaproteobacteria bacterium]
MRGSSSTEAASLQPPSSNVSAEEREMMTVSGRIGIAAIAFALLAGAANAQTSNAPLKKVTFLTNYIFHGRHTPFFVARDKGFYKEAGLDVDIQPSTGSGFVLSALEGGKAEYGMAESASTVQAISKGAKVKGFDVFMDVTTSGLASLKPFPTPQSVVGHTVGAS